MRSPAVRTVQRELGGIAAVSWRYRPRCVRATGHVVARMTPDGELRVAPCATPETSLPLDRRRYPFQTGNCHSLAAAADRRLTIVGSLLHSMPARRVAHCPPLSASRCLANQRGCRLNAALPLPRCLSWGRPSKQRLCLLTALIGRWLASAPPQQPSCVSFTMQERAP